MNSKNKLSTFSENDSIKYRGNIENYIGYTQIPTGIVGPLLINSTLETKEYYIPMATTEGGLIVSYNKGIKLVSSCGGVVSRCINNEVQRSPGFKLKSLIEAIKFEKWVKAQLEIFRQITNKVSKHASLKSINSLINGYLVTIEFSFDTKDASGQNMTTICTQEICAFIKGNCVTEIDYWFIESNFSGDKKATAKSLLQSRGKKVIAEAVIDSNVLKTHMNVTTEQMLKFWNFSTLSTLQSGAIGTNGHFANALASIFLACGQDIASIGEASTGIVFGDLTKNGSLYVSVTLPNLIVGTVGGGTNLTTQSECLELLDCVGNGKAELFAEICAAVVLAGEISIAASICCGTFTRSHLIYGRKRKNER